MQKSKPQVVVSIKHMRFELNKGEGITDRDADKTRESNRGGEGLTCTNSKVTVIISIASFPTQAQRQMQ